MNMVRLIKSYEHITTVVVDILTYLTTVSWLNYIQYWNRPESTFDRSEKLNNWQLNSPDNLTHQTTEDSRQLNTILWRGQSFY